MPSFPFFRLPILIQLLILKNVDLLELFYFSLISKRSKQIVKYLDLTLSTMLWDINDHSKKHNLLTLTGSHDQELTLYTKIDQNVIHSQGFIPFGQFTINGKVLSVSRSENALAIQDEMSERERLELMDQLTEHFLELFNVSEYKADFSNSYSLLDCFVWKYTKTFVTVNEHSWNISLTGEEVKFLLEEITTDKLVLFTKVEQGFKYSGPLKMKDLCVKRGEWLTLESILTMDCESLIFQETVLTYKDLNTIIKKWLAGGIKNLKEMYVISYKPVPEDSRDTILDQMLEGIESFPWDINNRPGDTMSNGRDIRRIDGTFATLEYVSREEFLAFRVWNP